MEFESVRSRQTEVMLRSPTQRTAESVQLAGRPSSQHAADHSDLRDRAGAPFARDGR
jgi:hypothetical protein